MTDGLTILITISGILLVVGSGWLARYRGVLNDETTRALSHFVVDYALPAMILASLLRTIDPTLLRANWSCPLLAAGTVLLAWGIGLPLAWLVAKAPLRRTFAFVVAMPNWLYFPLILTETLLPQAEADEARAILLLCNLGIMPLIWSFGIWMLRGGDFDREALVKTLKNPGLIATLIGILLAVFVPATRSLHALDPRSASAALCIGSMLVKALALLGSVTLPLSLVVIGAQMGGLNLKRREPFLALALAVMARLVAAPLLTALLLGALASAGLAIPALTRSILILIATMPIALNASLLASRYSGDGVFVAQGVLISTLLSVVTIPILLNLFW